MPTHLPWEQQRSLCYLSWAVRLHSPLCLTHPAAGQNPVLRNYQTVRLKIYSS